MENPAQATLGGNYRPGPAPQQMYSTIGADENVAQPRAFIAHQQAVDLILVALISTHPEPERVMHQFRSLVNQLTAATPPSGSDGSFLTAIRRSATRFDVMVERLLPAINPPHDDAPPSISEPGTRRDP